jgi:cytoplasmic tRNA 2-thiolation protein 2
MCNVEEPVMIPSVSAVPPPPGNTPLLCIKCKSAAPVLAVRQSIYCRSCFLAGFLLKFRTACAKNRDGMEGEQTLLCFSGALSSRALLWAALEPSRSSPQRLNTNTYTLLYLDEGKYERQEIEAFLQANNVKFIIKQITHISSDTSDTTLDLAWHAKTKIFFETAKELGCSKIYTGENSTKTAIRIIEYTAKGRGYSLPYDVRRNDAYRETLGICLVRPLAELTLKEVAFFCRFNGLLDQAIALHPKHHSFSLGSASIASATEHFIMGLERDYSSTVSTVAKTASKFTTGITQKREGKRCRICDCLVPEGIAEWFLGTTVLDLNSNATARQQRHASDLCYACCML